MIITFPIQPVYQAQVDDTVELSLSGVPTYGVMADPAYLQLTDSGATQSFPVTQFWRWRAIVPGTTYITANPGCRLVNPPCGLPGISVRIDISP